MEDGCFSASADQGEATAEVVTRTTTGEAATSPCCIGPPKGEVADTAILSTARATVLTVGNPSHADTALVGTRKEAELTAPEYTTTILKGTCRLTEGSITSDKGSACTVSKPKG